MGPYDVLKGKSVTFACEPTLAECHSQVTVESAPKGGGCRQCTTFGTEEKKTQTPRVFFSACDATMHRPECIAEEQDFTRTITTARQFAQSVGDFMNGKSLASRIRPENVEKVDGKERPSSYAVQMILQGDGSFAFADEVTPSTAKGGVVLCLQVKMSDGDRDGKINNVILKFDPTIGVWTGTPTDDTGDILYSARYAGFAQIFGGLITALE